MIGARRETTLCRSGLCSETETPLLQPPAMCEDEFLYYNAHKKRNSRVRKSTTTQKPLQSLRKTLQKYTPGGRSAGKGRVPSPSFRTALNPRTKGTLPKTGTSSCTPLELRPGCLLLPSSYDTPPHRTAMTFLLLPTDSLFQEDPSLQKRLEPRA